MESIEQKIEVSQKYAWESNVPLVVFLSLVVGALSGLVNAFLVDIIGGDIGSYVYVWLAGIFFGIITLPWILFILHKEMTKMKKFGVSSLWVVISFLSYFLAVWFFTNYFMEKSNFGGGVTRPGIDPYLIITGCIGAFIVAVASHFLFKKTTLLTFVLICVAGGIVPFLTGAGNNDISSPWLLYPIWQGVITAILGYIAIRKDSQKI